MSKTIGEAQYKDIKNKNLKIEKIAYDETEQRHFINESLYFCNVSR
ncbi:hypothetical protein [Helicobacter muridarum]|uniref:Adenine specific DNA methyltransferase n=1 Tax=Helicobacter muridarum TaxID=216 RepID=A0A377PWN3_9HELI|nr:hypothetical protein [Helicobacter muridarum]STQ86854.1 adenine specific DNA methyltransferase [Helicobacter muridarum]